MSKRKFYKMHGAGNDYIYFDCFDAPIYDPAAVAKKLSDRHFSVGGDGIVLILPSSVADARMRMFNADGSEGKMCGNAIRCVGKFLYEVRGLQKNIITVETLSGVKTLQLTVNGGEVSAVTVDMGRAELDPAKIPVLYVGSRMVNAPVTVDDEQHFVTCVSMGNPHCVVFGGDPDGVPLEKIGPVFETLPLFPDRINTEFIEVLGKNELKMRVWERGSGETLACGTGACAAAVAAVLNGHCEENAEIAVHLRGGTLTVRYTGETVFMTGPAEFAFTGEADL